MYKLHGFWNPLPDLLKILSPDVAPFFPLCEPLLVILIYHVYIIIILTVNYLAIVLKK